MQNTKIIGYVSAIIATVLLGALGIFVRNISANGYVITLARLGFGLVFLIIFLFFKGEIKNIKATQYSFPLLATGILLAATSICYINAINDIPLASAVFLLYLGPFIAVGMAAIFLKERLTLRNGVLLCFAFLGFLFLLEFKFSFTPNGAKGYLWGVGAAICYALYITFNRKIPQEIPALTRSFYQLLFGTITIMPLFDASFLRVTAIDMWWLIAIGFFQGFLAFSLIILALKYLKAVEFGTIAYVEPLVASLIGFALYSERLTMLQCIGCAIIFLGGMIRVVTGKD